MPDNLNDSMIETIQECPICRHEGNIVIPEVYDWMFKSSEHMWQYSECNKCGSLYLPRRIVQENIFLAYKNYYTHGGIDLNVNTWKFLKNRLITDYLVSEKKSSEISAEIGIKYSHRKKSKRKTRKRPTDPKYFSGN